MTRARLVPVLLTIPAILAGCGCEEEPGPAPTAKTEAVRPTVPKAKERREHKGAVFVGDQRREYVLHLPHRPRKGGKGPLLVMLTERGGTPGRFSGRSDIISGASKLGYVLAVPEAPRKGWEHEVCASKVTAPSDAKTRAGAAPAPAKKASSDAAVGSDAGTPALADVAFVGALIDELVKRRDVDDRQVYLLGTDAGAALAAKATQTLSSKVSALALNISEPVCPNDSWNLESAQPGVPTLVIRQADTVADAAAKKAPDAIDALLRLHQCSKSAAPTAKADEKLEPTAYDCKGAALSAVEVPRAGKQWPQKVGSLYSLRLVHQFFERL